MFCLSELPCFKRLGALVRLSLLLSLGVTLAWPSDVWAEGQAVLDRLQHFNEIDGLSHNRTNAVLQSRQGFLWIGTEDGLDRYDGYTFKTIRFPSKTGARMDVMALFEARNGVIWAGLRDGVASFDPVTEDLRFFPPAPELEISKGRFFSFGTFEGPRGAIWLGSADGLLRVDLESGQVVRVELPRVEPTTDAPERAGVTARPQHAYAVTEDGTEALWIGAEKGLYRLDIATDSVQPWPIDSLARHSNPAVYRVHVDANGGVWLGTSHGLWTRPAGKSTFEAWRLDATVKGKGTTGNTDFTASVLALGSDDFGLLWYLTPQGLRRWKIGTTEFGTFPLCPEDACLKGQFFNGYIAHRGGNGDLWIATVADGLLHFDSSEQIFVQYSAKPDHPGGLLTDTLFDLVEDQHGILWLATSLGLTKMDPRRTRFKGYDTSPLTGDLSGPGVWGIHQDDDGVLWIGTYIDGLNALDRRNGTTRPYRPTDESVTVLPGSDVTSIAGADRGRLWIGTGSGLSRLDPTTEQFEHFPANPDSLQGPYHELIFALLSETSRLWVSHLLGVDLYREERREFQRCMIRGENRAVPVYWIAQASDGGVWAASSGGGLFHFDRECADPPTQILPIPGQPNSLASEDAVAVLEDAQGIVWIGMEGAGLDRWDPAQGIFQHFRAKDGLPSDRVLGIVEDDQGFLWLATGRGLSRFDKAAETFRNFDVGDGLINNAFTLGSVHKGRSGELFFGGGLGLTALHPQAVVQDLETPVIALTDFTVNYESALLAAEDPHSPLERSIGFVDRVVLDHHQNIFGVEMAPLHFSNPQKNQLEYRLEGFNEDWVQGSPTQRLAQYSNLKPGEYTLHGRAANADGYWSEEQSLLQILVLPPPWKTWWAYGLYALSALLLLWAYASWHRRRLAKAQEINRQLREVDRFKDEFLANTSHELRTPLYGITGLAESLLEGAQGTLSGGARSNLQMIVTSGQRLAGLVNQILDFSKAKRDHLQLIRRPVDLKTLTDVVLAIIQPLVRGKDLVLVNHLSENLPPALGDEDRLHQVLLNLVGNAVKFTDQGEVEITAVEDDNMLTVRVTDSGIGIAKDRQERIFEAFEQGDATAERSHAGTGLGLAVTRELVTLHGGKLWVDSAPDKGSTFSFTLPVAGQDALAETADDSEDPERAHRRVDTKGLAVQSLGDWATTSNPQEEVETKVLGHSTAGGKILVVDDELVLRQVLNNFLTPEGYDIRLAGSGREALQLLQTESFDLVLLDVMMPRMSGFDVCSQIRRQWPVEALPVIFLTAKNQVSDLVRAFGDGASDYLTKPIARQELLSRVKTHLDLAVVYRQQAKEVKMLSGLLPICSCCKQIRDDEGEWNPLEAYIDSRSEASFSHGICPACVDEYYPDVGTEPTF